MRVENLDSIRAPVSSACFVDATGRRTEEQEIITFSI
jgi:hypothetical protein